MVRVVRRVRQKRDPLYILNGVWAHFHSVLKFTSAGYVTMQLMLGNDFGIAKSYGIFIHFSRRMGS